MVHEQINKPRGFELVCERPFRFEARWRQHDLHVDSSCKRWSPLTMTEYIRDGLDQAVSCNCTDYEHGGIRVDESNASFEQVGLKFIFEGGAKTGVRIL